MAKSELPIERCAFARDRFQARIAEAHLEPGRLRGAAESGGRRIAWDLSFSGGQEPLFDLPLPLYEARLPRAKALVGAPLCRYDGVLAVDGAEKVIEGWIGSQNHNWGSQHTDHYAWGQVAGFDNAPESFLELATARLRIGPLWTPFMTPIVLRHAGQEHAINRLRATFRNQGSFDYFRWAFAAESEAVRLDGTIEAQAKHFAALTYYNPPGGSKCCLNSKIASCRLELRDKRTGRSESLVSRHRAAFEILTDDFESHGIERAV